VVDERMISVSVMVRVNITDSVAICVRVPLVLQFLLLCGYVWLVLV